MKNLTAQLAKVAIIALTIAGMVLISKVPGITGNPVASIIAGIALAIVMGNLMKVISRKQREHATN